MFPRMFHLINCEKTETLTRFYRLPVLLGEKCLCYKGAAKSPYQKRGQGRPGRVLAPLTDRQQLAALWSWGCCCTSQQPASTAYGWVWTASCTEVLRAHPPSLGMVWAPGSHCGPNAQMNWGWSWVSFCIPAGLCLEPSAGYCAAPSCFLAQPIFSAGSMVGPCGSPGFGDQNGVCWVSPGLRA